jgi:hypothetical protein
MYSSCGFKEVMRNQASGIEISRPTRTRLPYDAKKFVKRLVEKGLL